MIKKGLKGLMVLLLIIVCGFLLYTQIGVYRPLVEGFGEETENGLYFPGNETKIIIYPGGKVDYRAYNVLAMELQERGYDVTIVKMPLNLAVLAPDKADDLEGSILIGHSLGGAMAARYADRHPDRLEGLVLLGAYPAESTDLSSEGIAVLSIRGSEDRLATQEKLEATRDLLPDTTVFLTIEGGNHAGFGAYGPQKGDGENLLDDGEQVTIAVQAIDEFIRGLGVSP